MFANDVCNKIFVFNFTCEKMMRMFLIFLFRQKTRLKSDIVANSLFLILEYTVDQKKCCFYILFPAVA